MLKTVQTVRRKSHRALKLALILLSFSLAVIPGPAFAAYPVIDRAFMAQQLASWQAFSVIFNLRMDHLASAIAGAASGQTEAATKGNQAVAKGLFTINRAVVQAQNTVTKTTTDEGREAICSQVLAMQVDAIGEMWRDTLTDFLDSTPYSFGGTTPYCRGPIAGHSKNANCSGPQGVKEYLEARCNLKTGSKLDGDKDACYITADADAAGLDRSPMRAIFGTRKMFQEPKKGINGNSAKGTKERAQDDFLRAVNSCYNLYGLPSARPYGINTPSDAVTAVQVESVETNRRSAMRECLRNVADNTIINPDGGGTLSQAHTKMKEKCENARKRKLDVSKYGDCKHGITPAESREITARLCTTTSHYKAMAAGTTASEKDISAGALACVGISQNHLFDAAKRQSDFANVVASMAGK